METDSSPGPRPLSYLSSSSGNTEESVSTFAEQTLQNLAQMDPSLDITFLAAPDKTPSQEETDASLFKASESEPLSSSHPEANQAELAPPRKTDLFGLSTFDLGEEPKKGYFETDASEIEEVCDSAGADGLTDRPTSSIVGSDLLAAPEKMPETEQQSTWYSQGTLFTCRVIC